MKKWIKENLIVFVLVIVILAGAIQIFRMEEETDADYSPSDRCLEVVEHQDLDESLDCYCKSPEGYVFDDVPEEVKEVTYVTDVIVCELDVGEDLEMAIWEIDEQALEESDLDEEDLPDDMRDPTP